MAMGEAVQKIKDRLSIVDVVSPYVELHPAGKNLKGKSPFTAEKTPSFYVSPDRGMYYCFSSSQGGDIFTFIQKMEGIEFKDALKLLAERAGVELVPEDPQKKGERERLFELLEEATRFFEEAFTHAPEVGEYMDGRGVSKETIRKWRIGYAPGPPKNGWRHLKEHLEKKGYTREELFKAGLIKMADAGKEPYDLFRDRIMFPLFDSQGRVVAFSGRIFSKESEAPKYVNSPETELFNKSELLYGYHLAKEGIRKLGFSLVVEGQFDVVLSHQAGYTNTVAVSGTALTAAHVSLLERLSPRVVLALDADRAGISAVKRASLLMLPRGIDLKVANMVGGKDPADLVREDKEQLRKVVGSAEPVVEYFLTVLEGEKKDERTFRLRVREEVVPLLTKIGSKIDQEHFMGVIAERIGTTKEAIMFEVERLLEQKEPVTEKALSEERALPQEKYVHPERRKEELRAFVAMLPLIISERTPILERAFSEVSETTAPLYRESLQPERQSALLFTIESHLERVGARRFYDEVIDALNELHRFFVSEKIMAIRESMAEKERAGNHEEITPLLSELSKLQRDKSLEPYSIELFI